MFKCLTCNVSKKTIKLWNKQSPTVHLLLPSLFTSNLRTRTNHETKLETNCIEKETTIFKSTFFTIILAETYVLHTLVSGKINIFTNWTKIFLHKYKLYKYISVISPYTSQRNSFKTVRQLFFFFFVWYASIGLHLKMELRNSITKAELV